MTIQEFGVYGVYINSSIMNKGVLVEIRLLHVHEG